MTERPYTPKQWAIVLHWEFLQREFNELSRMEDRPPILTEYLMTIMSEVRDYGEQVISINASIDRELGR